MIVYQKAYAKINLVLNILNKRKDGFHEVDFVMTTINLYDTVTITKNNVDQVICKKMPFLKKENNLAYQAWLLLKKTYNLQGHVQITIDKVIPVSAGMAGGSSDCAAVIRGINKLYNLNLSNLEMQKIGAKLGSDVPFCIGQKLAHAQGRGEIITLLDKRLPQAYIVAINPGVFLSTAKVFANHVIKHMPTTSNKIIDVSNFKELCLFVNNDLEITAQKIEPKILEVKSYISECFGNKILMSGSGATVLVFCKNNNEAKKIYKHAKKKYKNSYFAKMR